MKQAPQACSQTEGSFVELSLGDFLKAPARLARPRQVLCSVGEQAVPSRQGPGQPGSHSLSARFIAQHAHAAILKGPPTQGLGKGIKGTINM